eukprot:ANDGO_00754.mRNA.1 putative alpha-tubulin polyglutamylase Ttll1
MAEFLYRTTFTNTVHDALEKRGWRETESDQDFDVAWVSKGWIRTVFPKISGTLKREQLVNHFPNTQELTRKDLLQKNLKRFQATETVDFMPATFLLPNQYHMFEDTFKKSSAKMWILKPIGLLQGQGISLVTNISQVSEFRKAAQNPNYMVNAREAASSSAAAGSSSADSGSKSSRKSYASSSSSSVSSSDDEESSSDSGPSSEKKGGIEPHIVQRYIDAPLLIGGKKFDMRIYVLVTSFTPLTAFLYRGGFCRFSGSRYSTSAKDTENMYVHLTNHAIQKKAESFHPLNAGVHVENGTTHHDLKWALLNLRTYLNSKHGFQRTDEAFAEIQHVLLTTLRSVEKVMFSDYRCFELYGFDILIDENLKPWILEVNASPSLSASSDQDKALKEDLVSETLDIVIYEKRRKRHLYQGDAQDQTGGGGGGGATSAGNTVNSLPTSPFQDVSHSQLQSMLGELEHILRGFDPIYYDGKDLSNIGITLGSGHGGTMSSTGGQGILGRTGVRCRLGTELRAPISLVARNAALGSRVDKILPIGPGPGSSKMPPKKPGDKPDIPPSAKTSASNASTQQGSGAASNKDRPRSRSASASKRRSVSAGSSN